jgi:hypothetical protein
MSVTIETPTGSVTVTSTGDFVCYNAKSEAITTWVYQGLHNALAVVWGDKMYTYLDVEFSEIHAMMSADSLGKFINEEIKPKHKFF